MYDALLALRGWGADDFRLADTTFLDAVRWALFAERVGPLLAQVESNLADPMPRGLEAPELLRVGKARAGAAAAVASARSLLYPED